MYNDRKSAIQCAKIQPRSIKPARNWERNSETSPRQAIAPQLWIAKFLRNYSAHSYRVMVTLDNEEKLSVHHVVFQCDPKVNLSGKASTSSTSRYFGSRCNELFNHRHCTEATLAQRYLQAESSIRIRSVDIFIISSEWKTEHKDQ